MEEKVEQYLQSAVSEHVFPGCVVGIVDRFGKRIIIPVGHFTYERSSPPVTAHSIYDVASVTKAIPVTCLALQLIDEGKISLTDKAVTYVPELKKTSFGDEVLIRHLLTMTLDYNLRLSSLKHMSPEKILETIFATKFRYKPGERMNYTNATSIVLGLIIERVTGKRLDTGADERFFSPLGMSETTFHPETLPRERIVPTEDDPWRGRIIQGEVHDESASVLRQQMIPGSAGLFSTAHDLLPFVTMLLHGGTYNRIRYFSEEMVMQMATNQLAAIGAVSGLGWELNQLRYMGKYASAHTIGKTGFTGCVVMCDIKKGKGLLMLSNYHFPRRKKDTKALNAVRRAIADIVFKPV